MFKIDNIQITDWIKDVSIDSWSISWTTGLKSPNYYEYNTSDGKLYRDTDTMGKTFQGYQPESISLTGVFYHKYNDPDKKIAGLADLKYIVNKLEKEFILTKNVFTLTIHDSSFSNYSIDRLVVRNVKFQPLLIVKNKCFQNVWTAEFTITCSQVNSNLGSLT